MTENLSDDLKGPAEQKNKPKKNPKKAVWTIIGIVILALVVIGAAGGGYMIHLSDTSPEFCGTCHIMQPNVTSYLTGNNLDNIHKQANVGCKQCHDYPVDAEVTSGLKYVVGDYTVGDDGKLLPVTYNNDMCLKCHISYDNVAKKTDFLARNPHKNHNGELPCKTCHISHGKQINYCSRCHDNGKQRMIGEEYEPRGIIH